MTRKTLFFTHSSFLFFLLATHPVGGTTTGSTRCSTTVPAFTLRNLLRFHLLCSKDSYGPCRVYGLASFGSLQRRKSLPHTTCSLPSRPLTTYRGPKFSSTVTCRVVLPTAPVVPLTIKGFGVARWQVDKLARWHGGKVAGWQGGKVAV